MNRWIGVTACWMLRAHRFAKPQECFYLAETPQRVAYEKTCRRCSLTVPVKTRKRRAAV